MVLETISTGTHVLKRLCVSGMSVVVGESFSTLAGRMLIKNSEESGGS
jgi:hypothetical protein